jgi:hypothetical protein
LTIYELLERVIAGLPKARLRVDQVALSVVFTKNPRDRRTPKRTIIITAPHTCRMINDERGEKIHRMLVASDIEKLQASDHASGNAA